MELSHRWRSSPEPPIADNRRWIDARIVAQEGVALEIAEAVVEALKGELATTAVNAPIVPAEKLFDCG
ncbi:hypothetical protein V6N13_021807 [Hibiscus sabdariffa]|uniref:Uncharacterized protein n=1 Tax=Hibiscus sabdariffa TaxID=183260 RepID=A0ABR2CPR7_9ROSI